ncbi:MAG TPA: radical SAM protein [Vicinamibacteria bacterium]|nr:radical SAM protein [Vicinamibacteria bacterium]
MTIRAGVPAPNLEPRLGQEAFRRRGEVAYRVLETRSLLGRCTSERMPFEWTANPYRGCAMGCRYCYATYTHEFLGLTDPDAFHTAVWVKRGGDAETQRRLRAAIRRGERVALGTATDPYQPGEAQEGVTRRFLELCARERGLRLGLITKGALVLRDVDLLRRIHQRGRLSISVSLISTDAALLRRLEPWAPPPLVRLEVLRRLAEAGLDAGLAILPILPGLTDDEATLDALLARAGAAGVRRFNAGLLFLRSPTRERFLAFLDREFPRFAEAYRLAYADRAYLGGGYRDRVLARVDRLAERHGLRRAGEYGTATARLDVRSQLRLFS